MCAPHRVFRKTTLPRTFRRDGLADKDLRRFSRNRCRCAQGIHRRFVMPARLRVGLIGAGNNTLARHIPGLHAEADVEIVAVCNRRPESTAALAPDYGIPPPFAQWPDLLANP